MKKSALAILVCIAFFITSFSQTVDSVLSESKTNGVWQNSALDIYTRNDSCMLLSSLTLTWNEASQSWINSFRSTYSYTNTKDISEALSQGWDAVNNTWVNNSRSVFFTDNGGTIKTYISQTWDASTSTWLNSYRIVENTDGQGRTISSEFDFYSNNEWQKIQRGLLSYDALNRIEKSIFQTWGANGWVNNGKTTYNYSGKGMTFDYLWDNTNSVWTIFRRAYNDYIENTSLSKQLLGQLLSGTDWQNAYRGNSSYNNSNLLLTNSQEFWDASTLSWINGFRLSIDYYADAYQHHFKYENWDASTSSWSSGFRSTNSDVSCINNLQIVPVATVNNRIALLSQNINGKNLLHLTPHTNTIPDNSFKRTFNPLASNGKNIVYDISFNNNGNQYAFELVLSTISKPQSISSSSKENAIVPEQKSFTISPNPAKNYFNINLPSWKNAGNIVLKISDASGKIIMQQKADAGMQRVNLPSLQKGLYIVMITSGKEMHTQKLIIE